jgi:hypothetical protein
MKFTVGTRVLTLTGYEGAIFRVYDDFSAIRYTLGKHAYEWESLQQPPLTAQEKAEPWYQVHVDTGGALWVPESRLDPETSV